MPAADPAVMKIVNPATGAMIADIPEDGAFAVRKKYERARAAQPAWAATPIKKRVDAIRRFRDCVTARHETLARTLTAEVGKPIAQSRNELKGLLPRIDFFLEQAAQVLRPERVMKDAAMEVQLYHLRDNPREGTNLFAYVPRERILVQADLYDSTWQFHHWGENVITNIEQIRKLKVDRQVPVHGAIEPYAVMVKKIRSAPKG